jgi:hypothetical protein
VLKISLKNLSLRQRNLGSQKRLRLQDPHCKESTWLDSMRNLQILFIPKLCTTGIYGQKALLFGGGEGGECIVKKEYMKCYSPMHPHASLLNLCKHQAPPLSLLRPSPPKCAPQIVDLLLLLDFFLAFRLFNGRCCWTFNEHFCIMIYA